MARYYEDETIILALEELYKSPWAQGDEKDGLQVSMYNYGVQDSLRMLKDIIAGRVPDTLKISPSDVKPLIHGKWERHFTRPNVYADLFYYCSACGNRTTSSDTVYYKYCPKCGAKMDAEGDA